MTCVDGILHKNENMGVQFWMQCTGGPGGEEVWEVVVVVRHSILPYLIHYLCLFRGVKFWINALQWGPREGRGVGGGWWWCGIQSGRTMEPNWGPGDEGGIIAGALYTLYPLEVFAAGQKVWRNYPSGGKRGRDYRTRAFPRRDFARRIVQRRIGQATTKNCKYNSLILSKNYARYPERK